MGKISTRAYVAWYVVDEHAHYVMLQGISWLTVDYKRQAVEARLAKLDASV